MHSKFSLLVLSLGLSLISSVAGGCFFKSTEYELFNQDEGKKIVVKSIPKGLYYDYYNITIIQTFNIEKAIVFGLLAFGISLVGISFIKNKS